LRNPLSCYTLRPSIAARTKNTVLCLAAPSASGVNILSTLFFHRTSRTLLPLVFSLFPLVPFSFPPRSRYGRKAGGGSFVRSLPRPESIVVVVVVVVIAMAVGDDGGNRGDEKSQER